MAFRIQDLPKTTRRGRDGEPPRLFPRLLTGDRLDPRIGVAIRFLETNLGRTRAMLDGTALVDLFGDARLARCLTACLAQSYRYTMRRFEDVVGMERAAALIARGVATPMDLRALAYARANDDGGFVAPLQRETFLLSLAPGVEPHEVDRLLWLDAPDQAVLVRVGPPPTVAEVRAHYNLRVLEAVLAGAAEVELSGCVDAEMVALVANHHGVEYVREGEWVRFSGRPDAVGSWVRHGARLARATLLLLAAGALGPGTATLHHNGDRYQVMLDRAFLRRSLPVRGWTAAPTSWQPVEELLQVARQQGALTGWRVQRWPAALVAETGAAWPEVTLVRGPLSVGVLPLADTLSPVGAGPLAALAERRACLFLSDGPVPAPLSAAPVLPLTGAGAVAALAAALERRWLAATGAPEWFTALAEAACASGSLAESELARRLDCDEAHVGARLARLPASDVVYIAGFGLCAAALLDHASALVREEVASNDGQLELTRLGRRLQTLVGRNEGLHALIGYLAGELRLVA